MPRQKCISSYSVSIRRGLEEQRDNSVKKYMDGTRLRIVLRAHMIPKTIQSLTDA